MERLTVGRNMTGGSEGEMIRRVMGFSNLSVVSCPLSVATDGELPTKDSLCVEAQPSSRPAKSARKILGIIAPSAIEVESNQAVRVATTASSPCSHSSREILIGGARRITLEAVRF